MIVGSIVAVLTAAVLLVLGLVEFDVTLFYSSIVASAVAALAVVVGVRQFPAGRVPEADFDVRPGGPGLIRRRRPIGRAGVPRQSRAESPSVAREGAVLRGSGLAGSGRAGSALEGYALDGGHAHLSDLDRAQLDQADLTIPADEPAEQLITSEAAARVARLRAEVVVVDDRPRYHRAECLHLLGRQGQPLSVRQATRLGFTPCALCEPVTALLTAD